MESFVIFLWHNRLKALIPNVRFEFLSRGERSWRFLEIPSFVFAKEGIDAVCLTIIKAMGEVIRADAKDLAKNKSIFI